MLYLAVNVAPPLDVLVESALEIVGHADVEPVRVTGQDVDIELAHAPFMQPDSHLTSIVPMHDRSSARCARRG